MTHSDDTAETHFAHQSPLTRLLALVRRAGLRNAVGRVVFTAIDRTVNPVDRRFGTVTGTRVGSGAIASEVAGESGGGSSEYVAMVGSAFRAGLARLDPHPSGTFVDVGCGEGRCLVLAAAHGYGRVVGIEHAPSLAAAARANLDRAHVTDGEVWEADATLVELPADTSLIWLYNPFSPDLWRRFLDGPVAALGRPVRLLTHAMPDAASAPVLKVALVVETTTWVRGRDLTLLVATPVTDGRTGRADIR